MPIIIPSASAGEGNEPEWGDEEGPENPLVFPDDLVELPSAAKTKVGLVLNVAGVSDDEESDEEDAAMESNHALVYWLGKRPKIEGVDRLKVIDRAFLHGDVVVGASDPVHGRTGTVTDVNMTVDVESVANPKIVFRGLSTDLIEPICPYLRGRFVVKEQSTLGRVDEILMYV